MQSDGCTFLNSWERTRIQPLDDAFLFSIGSTNIVVVFFQIMLSGTDAALLSVPLLIVGLFVPFYIGYLRGAIVVDTVLERIRGWIYFSAGTSVYIAGLAVILLRDYGDLSLILYLLFYGAGFVLSRSWIRSIVRATGAHLSKKDLVVIGATVGATIALLYAVLSGEEHIRFYMASSQSWRPEGVIIRIGTVAFALLVFIIIERSVRRLALSTHEITLSYDVNSVSGASGQVMMSSSMCLLKGAMSDKKALLSAGMSFLIYFALVTVDAFPNLFPMPNTVTVVTIGLAWLVLYIFAFYRYLKVQMKIPTTDEIFILHT